MDKDILNYLDKVGQYVQGASEKGFEVYVHGVFVESLLYLILGFIMVVISIVAITMVFKKLERKDDISFYSVILGLFIIIGVILISSKATGVFAPDYVAIKQIIDGTGGK